EEGDVLPRPEPEGVLGVVPPAVLHRRAGAATVRPQTPPQPAQGYRLLADVSGVPQQHRAAAQRRGDAETDQPPQCPAIPRLIGSAATQDKDRKGDPHASHDADPCQRTPGSRGLPTPWSWGE